MTTDDTAGAPDAVATDVSAAAAGSGRSARRNGRCRWPSASCSSPGWRRSAPGRSTPVSPACTPSTTTLARLFVARRRRPDRCRPARPRARVAGSPPSRTVLVNLGAVAAWGATRLWGISWIDGLEVAEDPQFTDTACAVLGAIAVVAAVVALVRGRTTVSTRAPRVAGLRRRRRHAGRDARRHQPLAQPRRGGGGRLGGRGAGRRRRRPHPQPRRRGHAPARAAAAPTDWPRPFDPAQPIDLSGVDGVTPEQELRATALVQTHAARSCRRSPTSTRSTSSATARSATPAPATSTTSTTR